MTDDEALDALEEIELELVLLETAGFDRTRYLDTYLHIMNRLALVVEWFQRQRGCTSAVARFPERGGRRSRASNASPPRLVSGVAPGSPAVGARAVQRFRRRSGPWRPRHRTR